MKVAHILRKTQSFEEVRGFYRIEFTSSHVVFHMDVNDPAMIVAIHANDICELTVDEE